MHPNHVPQLVAAYNTKLKWSNNATTLTTQMSNLLMTLTSGLHSEVCPIASALEL